MSSFEQGIGGDTSFQGNSFVQESGEGRHKYYLNERRSYSMDMG